MYQDGDYLQPIGQYNQTICRLQYVMIPPSGREHYSVHSWKAGPDCGKIYLFSINHGLRMPYETFFNDITNIWGIFGRMISTILAL